MKFVIPVDVTEVDGSQTFLVEADSIEEAIKKLKEGGGEFLEESIEITSLDFDNIDERDCMNYEDY